MGLAVRDGAVQSDLKGRSKNRAGSQAESSPKLTGEPARPKRKPTQWNLPEEAKKAEMVERVRKEEERNTRSERPPEARSTEA